MNRAKYGRSESFWATSVGKHWKSCESGGIGHCKSFWATSVGKHWKSCEIGDCKFFESFHSKAPRNDPQWQIWPKSGLDLVKVANFGHFAGFSPKVWLRLTWNGQFHRIHNFSNHFTAKAPQKWPTMAKFTWPTVFPIFSHRSGLEWLGQNGQFCPIRNFCNLFPQSKAEIDLEWPISPDSQLFQSFPTKSGSERLRMANFTWLTVFPIFSHRSGPEWLGMGNFARFATFPIFFHQSGSE